MSTLNVTNLAGPSNTGTAATLSSINDGPISGARNRIINGDMRIDQRNGGASFTSNGLLYCLDRWLLQAVGANNTAQQVTGSTGNNRAVRITGNTGNTLTGLSQKIESWNILDLAAQPVTVSFTLSGSTSGSVSVRRLYPTAADNYSSTTEPVVGTTVNFTTTPTRYTVTFTADPNANKGLWLYFDFGGVGSGVTRTLEDVQLEAGTVATPFERRSYGQELSLCQRYFETGEFSSSGITHVGNGDTRSSFNSYVVTKRALPSVTLNSNTISVFAVGANGAGVNLNASVGALSVASLNGFGLANMGNYTNISNAVGGGDYVYGLRNNHIFYANAEL